MKFDDLLKTILNILLSVVGFFLITHMNRSNEQLAKINEDILQVKIEITSLNSKMMTEDKVKDLIRTELLKEGLITNH